MQAAGSSITLTALAAPGRQFVAWTGGGCSGNATTWNVALTAATTVTAQFDVVSASPSINVSKVGGGSGTVTSSPAGINCDSTCINTPSSRTLVTLTAKPAAGSYFAGWSGVCSGVGSCVVTVTTASYVTARFEANGICLAGTHSLDSGLQRRLVILLVALTLVTHRHRKLSC